MLKHIVLFKLKKEKIHLKDRLIKELEKMSMDLFIKKEVGTDIVGSKRAYDVCLLIEFQKLDHLKEYDKFQPHLDLKDFFREVSEDIAVIDYEF